MTEDEALTAEGVERQISAILTDASRTMTTTGGFHPARESLDRELRETMSDEGIVTDPSLDHLITA